MIIVFHCLYIATKNCINLVNKSLKQDDLEITTTVPRNFDSDENLSFDPPVYKQRITEVLEVDIDEDILRENAFRVHPLIADYISRRTDPLNVHILKGSISYPDERLLNTDGVFGVEIIEHLYPDVLEALPYNVFGFIRPKIAVFTTPNADFNVLFPNFRGFRHYDHKFEWNREQFESWALNITTRFPNYSVTFKGIGDGPFGTESLGCCSQMCVFIKESEDNCFSDESQSSYGICTHFSLSNYLDTSKEYQLIEVVEYPYEIDERTTQEKICDELKYKINIMSNVNGRFFNNDLLRFEIPLEGLIFNQHTHYTTVTEARTILKEAGYRIEECIVFDKLEPCVVYEPDMESRSSTPASDTSDINVSKPYYTEWTKTESESDWETCRDGNPWLLDSSRQEHEEALIYANEIVHNLINNIEVTSPYESSSAPDKHKSLNKNKIDLKSCFDYVNIHKDESSSKQFKKDVSCPGISDIKKKKKSKKDSGQNGVVNGLVFNNEDFVEDIQLQQPCVDVVPEPVEEVVENGDLANNNRDLEGNNYPNAVENDVDLRENGNEMLDPDLQDNADEENRNNDAENRNDFVEVLAPPNLELEVVNDRDMEIEFASREALFDPNSQVDLLEEFDISAEGEPNNSLVELPILQNIVFVGVDPSQDDANSQIAAVLPINAEPFPNWLLNLLGAGVPEDAETHDEPHFYCQGDGLGVHPSFIEEEFDEESSSSDTSDSTTTGDSSHDEAEADPSVSELDIGSLPDDVTEPNAEQNSNAHVVTPVPDEPQKPESSSNHTATSSLLSDTTDEFFDVASAALSNNNLQKEIREKDSKV
ncbi:hypothetical protein RN001_004787 [Aquatica leii]|uniref:Small RNA 2'-O-methyltransferase n=1 Tax=Aquatica leii TaxID=1421715 RepID=A0AAN7PC31_9COLE|nr:hypothetical protein RN001_004787 [Aquatica leii]